MEICREDNMFRIKNKMTEIRRKQIVPIIHNYYLNCEQDEEIFAIFGQDTVVFWDDDKGVRRAYFYSNNPEELTTLLSQVPEGVIIDYLTYTKDEFRDLFENAGWRQLFEMHRMTAQQRSDEDAENWKKRIKRFDKIMYMKECVRVAVKEDCDEIYKKLFEIFDPRESHLCTREELLRYIENGWVTVYYEGEDLRGLHIFKVEKKRFYGYQIWNGAGPEGYYSLVRCSDQRFEDMMKRSSNPGKRPSYGWVNIKNSRAVRQAEFWGQVFDGLYDFVYEKLPANLG